MTCTRTRAVCLALLALPCAQGFGSLQRDKIRPDEDASEHCAVWAEDGECTKNPSFMQSECKYSCAPAELRAALPSEPEYDSSSAVFVNGTQLCPIRMAGERSANGHSGGVVLKVANQQMRNLELLWYNGRTEKRYWVVDARGEFTISTRSGDRWRLRMKSGELAAEILVGDETQQLYSIPHCLPPSQQAEAELAATHDLTLPTAAELDRCAPWAHLSRIEPSPGMHVVCILPHSPADATGGMHTLAVYADGWTGGGVAADGSQRPLPSHAFNLPRSGTSDVEAIAYFIMRRLHTPTRGPKHNAPALFLPSGERLHTVADVLAAACVLVFEGGMWVWPGGEVGRVHELQVADGEHMRNVSLTTMSLFPRVMLASNFLTEREAELIISRADGHMFKSGVSLKAADQGKASSDYRTSSQWSFPLWDDEIRALDRRVQQLTRIPMTHAEQIQVLRYQPWEHYTAHHDFFDPGEYAGRDRELGYARNRLATVFFYLNEPAAGGETGFPRANKGSQPRDFLDCTKGIAIKPQRLAVLIFYSMLPNGDFDQTSLHTGCDVKEGTKWAANFWFWNQPQGGGAGSIGAKISRELDNRSRVGLRFVSHGGVDSDLRAW